MLYEHIQTALQYIQQQTTFQPKYGIILGTGLGELVNEIDVVTTIAYKNIPHFPESTVESHQGNLIFGYLDAIPIVAMAGRFHYYEGYSMQQVTFPVRVLKALNIQRLLISNAAGSTNAHINAGDIVFVKDHINFHAENPLRGVNDERLGPRFPDMLHAYDHNLNQKALAIAKAHNIPAHEGVYFGLQGPNLETPAEYSFINKMGGDLVGMSTIPEVLVARHSGLPIFVLSVISNKCYPPSAIEVTTIESVLETVAKAAPNMQLIVRKILAYLN